MDEWLDEAFHSFPYTCTYYHVDRHKIHVLCRYKPLYSLFPRRLRQMKIDTHMTGRTAQPDERTIMKGGIIYHTVNGYGFLLTDGTVKAKRIKGFMVVLSWFFFMLNIQNSNYPRAGALCKKKFYKSFLGLGKLSRCRLLQLNKH